jgi:hypothetical protein
LRRADQDGSSLRRTITLLFCFSIERIIVPTVEHRINFDDAFQGIKAHVKRHKVAYTVGGVVVIAGVCFYAGRRVGSSRQIVDSYKLQINSPTTNNVCQLLVDADRKGPAAYIVRKKGTNQAWIGQTNAALANGHSPAAMSQHLNGKRPHVSGEEFERIGLELVLPNASKTQK